MAKDLPLLPPELELSSDGKDLSIRLDEALNKRSLLENRSTFSRYNTSNDYIRLENITNESDHPDQTSTNNEGFDLELSEKPNAIILTKAKRFWKGLLPGWRKALALNSLYITIVLFFNILWLSVTVSNFESEQGIYTLYKGSCSRVSTTNSVLHVLINILSTTLLSSSNYATQCLTSPTRTEVERAHRKRKWLHIGIPNMKNLLWISWRRKPLVILLVVSAWPLHLFWNSTVFKTIQANQYAIIIVSHDFVTSAQFDHNLSNLFALNAQYTLSFNLTAYLQQYDFSTTAAFLNFTESLYNKTKTQGSMALLQNSECMKTYSQPIISCHRNLLLVTNMTLPSQSPSNGSILAYLDSEEWLSDFIPSNGNSGSWNPGKFICDFDETIGFSGCNSNNLTVSPMDNPGDGPYTIDYCLSEIVDEVCSVQLLLPLMALVILCNFVKLVCVVCTIFTFQEPPLVVIGDACASFLEKRNDFSLFQFKRPIATNHPRHWAYTARLDMMLTIILSCATLVAAGELLRMSIATTRESLKTLGFGQAGPNTVIPILNSAVAQSLSRLTLVTLIVNSPQIVFTLLYLIYNRTYTKMLAMHQWSKLAFKRRTLRVSQPSGIQRSTYWLHLPYRYSIPLILMSSLMHWIISESFFLTRVAFYDKDGMPYFQWMGDSEDGEDREIPSSSNIATLPGYSPEAILVAIVVGGVMLLTLILLSFRKVGSAMPLVGNNSWAISTVCHRPDDDEEAASKAVKWGAINHPDGDRAGHCCLTSFEVEKPIEGGLYV